MEYKKAIEETIKCLNGSFRPDSNAEFSRKVKKRAENMTNNERNIGHPGLIEITPERTENRTHKVLSAAAGIAGTAAVLTGAVFGLNYIIGHGGLREGGTEVSSGAGYHEDITEPVNTEPVMTTNALAPAEAAAEELPDIREAFGKPVTFSDAVITLESAGYNGETLFAVFDVKFTGDDLDIDNYDFSKIKVLGTGFDNYKYDCRVEPVENGTESIEYTCVFAIPIQLDAGKAYPVNIHYYSGSYITEQDTQDYSFTYEPKEAAIKIDFLGDRDLGNFEFEYYIDGEYQNKTTVTKDMSERQLLEWNIKGSGVLTYRLDVRSVSTQCSGTLLEYTVDFSKDEPTKDLVGPLNEKIFKELAGMAPAGDWTKPADETEADDASGQEDSGVLPEDDTAAASAETKQDIIMSGMVISGVGAQEIIESSSVYDFTKPNFTFPINSFISDATIYDEANILWYFYDYNVQPVYAPFDGTIIENRTGRGLPGQIVTVKSDYGEVWEIASCGEVTVQPGDIVKKGDVIGRTADIDQYGRSLVEFSIYWDLRPGTAYPGEVIGSEALEKLTEYAGEDYHYPVDENYTSLTYYAVGDRFNISALSDTKEGDPIFAATGGTVVDVNETAVPGYDRGKYITVQAADGRKWQYSHCSEIYAKVGDTVSAGDKIAAIGATGWCTGPCLAIDFPE